MKDYTFKILKNAEISKDVYKMELECLENLPKIIAGQFLNLELPEGSNLLRRPFCVYDYFGRTVTIVYAVVGKGTRIMTALKAGESVRALMPLGNGFSGDSGNAAFLGGGMGCAALNLLAREHSGTAYLGFSTKADADIFLSGFKCNVKLATDDGSAGERGFPTALLERDILAGKAPSVIYVCGPHSMMKAARDIADRYDIPAYFTGESRMGCGFGVCLVCACKLIGDSGEENLRACKDGPVFDLRKAVL